MRPFRDTPISRKLTLMMMLISSIALLMTCGSFVVYEFVSFRTTSLQQLKTLAQIIAANNWAAVAFGDQTSAQETLGPLRTESSIVAACLYSKDGQIFAKYPEGLPNSSLPAKPEARSHLFEKGSLGLFEPIYNDNGQTVGTVYLKSNLQKMYAGLAQFGVIALAVMAVASGAAFVLSAKLQGWISEPIRGLSGLAKSVSLERNYSLRAVKRAEDEVGQLIEAFNEMLAQIEVRDEQLESAKRRAEEASRELQRSHERLEENNRTLELKVRQRTAELAEAVNEAERSRLAAETATRHKSEFVANMSHELRTPLNAVIGFSQVLLDQMFGPMNEKQIEYTNDILGSGQHLLSLINDILDLSKVEAGKMELEPTLFDLRQVLQGSLIMLKERAANHGIHLTVEIATGIGMVYADERKIKQILFNLLSNAVKFTPDRGAAGIKASFVGDELQIAVWDTRTPDIEFTNLADFLEFSC